MMRKTNKAGKRLSPVLAAAVTCGVALTALASSAHSQSVGDLLGSAKKVAQAAIVSDDQVVAYFSQMSDEMDRQNPIAPAKSP